MEMAEEMPRYVALRRGINVGRRNRVAMADLRQLAARQIAGDLAVRPAVVVLSPDELAQVIADNPVPGETIPSCLHAVIRRRAMSPEGIAAVAAAQQRARDKGSRDEAVVVGRVVFLRTPDGLGRGELAAQLARPAAGTTDPAGTARNWATVTRLLALLESAG
jgi:uncharacterized protein (DUF1697 family)